MNDRPTTVIASLSFEERCAAVSNELMRSTPGLKGSLVLLDYQGTATSGDGARLRREANWERLSEAAVSSGWVASRQSTAAYSMSDLEDVFGTIDPSSNITVDISCMTRPHVLAAATFLASRDDYPNWAIAYTHPITYGNIGSTSASGGWIDTLWLPLGDDVSLRNQGMSIGLIIAGHQPERTAVAFEEIAPAAGMFLYTKRADRPDLHQTTVTSHRSLTERLQLMKMPGQRADTSSHRLPTDGWFITSVDLWNLVPDLHRAVQQVIDAAQEVDSPVILYPMGPKIAVFLAAWMIAKRYPASSWAIYPVGRTHPLDYSTGVARSFVYSKAEIEQLTHSPLSDT